ncbi:MAG: YcaO-like family protein [Desulfobacteraceae bacterium]|nr:YcaO-like family protein [Desulfobacteraceae bacterium]
MTYGIHKDKSPLETIAAIRKILNESGLVVTENTWRQFGSTSFSVRLQDMIVGQVSVNGKGISKEFALAGAYAEYMERLSAGSLYRWKFGLMDEVVFQYPDQKELTVDECMENGTGMGLTREFLEKLAVGKSTVSCLPFFDCFVNSVVYFPVDVLYGGFTCTGMCSGNTAHEAVVHGICEIFERYVSQLMFHDEDLLFPNVPINRIPSPEIQKMIATIYNAGYNIIIKDMTLGGRFPVLAVVLLNRTRTRMKVSAGSFVTPEIALERCITEMFQGLEQDNYENSMTEIKFCNEFPTVRYSSEKEQRLYERERWRRDKSGRYPNRILCSGETGGNFMNGFLNNYSDSKTSLDFLLDIIKREGLELYVRDVSFLGFPAYFIYIPTLSEPGDWKKRTLDAVKLKSMKKLFARPNRLDENQLEKIAGFFGERSKNPIAPHTNFAELSSIHVTESHLISFPRLILWAMIYNRKHDYKKALDILTFALDNADYSELYNNAKASLPENVMRGLPSPAQFNWLILYFKLKTENCSGSYIKTNLSQIFSEQLTNIMLPIVNDGKKLFGSIEFPDCGDCSLCPVKYICNYETWKKTVVKLNSIMQKSFPRQSDLRCVLMHKTEERQKQ